MAWIMGKIFSGEERDEGKAILQLRKGVFPWISKHAYDEGHRSSSSHISSVAGDHFTDSQSIVPIYRMLVKKEIQIVYRIVKVNTVLTANSYIMLQSHYPVLVLQFNLYCSTLDCSTFTWVPHMSSRMHSIRTGSLITPGNHFFQVYRAFRGLKRR